MTYDTGSDQLTLETAFKAHHDWKIRLQDAVATGETLDLEKIRRDDICTLGKWLHGDARRQYGHLPEFTALLAKHKDFHSVAGVVAGLINGKDLDKALEMLSGSSHFGRASRDVGVAILALKKTI